MSDRLVLCNRSSQQRCLKSGSRLVVKQGPCQAYLIILMEQCMYAELCRCGEFDHVSLNMKKPVRAASIHQEGWAQLAKT